jgi:hypothetical protein
MTRRAAGAVFVLVAALGCSSRGGTHDAPDAPAEAQVSAPTAAAGFVEVPPRKVSVKGSAVDIATTARIFYSYEPAETAPEASPIVFLFNGYAAEIVRAFGTGRIGVNASGVVAPNTAPFTHFANLVYLDPRQSGYSYDVPPAGAPRSPSAADCGPDVFNEYVDAADVLLAALGFLAAHPTLRGPVYWLGESYGGVRVTWIVTYLRGRWQNVPYVDDTLAAAIASAGRERSLTTGQILLEGWVAGGPETTAIAAECDAAAETAAVAMSVGQSCEGVGACSCATQLGRSLYNYTYTTAFETERETQAILAHIDPTAAAALLGVSLESIPELAQKERTKGWKCVGPDSTIPSESTLEAALGPLPSNQVYYLDYSPLLPGKELGTPVTDWRTAPTLALAFVDNLHEVPTFLTRGARDLVVPTDALAPALSSAIGAARVDTSKTDAIGVIFPDGERTITIRDYANAGHMITMVQPTDLSADLEAWLRAL